MSKFRLMLLGTAAIGLTASAMSSAFAGEVERTIGMSGHVNRAITVGSNGNEGFTRHVDNYASSSRFRGTASAASESMTIGATLEMGAYINRSTGVSESATSQATTVGMRQSNVHVTTSMGKLKFGRAWGSNINNGVPDASGTAQVSSSGAGSFNGIRFFNTGTNAAGVTVGSMYDSTKGVQLATMAEYTTPDMNGFNASVGHAEQGSIFGGIGYSADYDGTAVTFGADYTRAGGDTIDNSWAVGASVLLASGLNAAVGFGRDNVNTNSATGGTTSLEDKDRLNVIVGYKMTGLSDLGGTNFAIEYVKVDDQDATASNADELTVYSFKVEQALTDYGTTIYGGYEHFAYDTNAGNFDEVNGGVVGLKVTF